MRDSNFLLEDSEVAFRLVNKSRKRSTTHRATPRQRVAESGEAEKILESLPANDNTPNALDALLQANKFFRTAPWPEPFSSTTHCLKLGDARDLSWIADESVHLVVTSPPYWTLKDYNPHENQMGSIHDYKNFLDELDKVWRECKRVLVPGGRICCVVGDVCMARKQAGRHYVVPLHADIQVRVRDIGLDNLTPILWHKIANGATEVEGNGAGFYGKPYQPGSVVKNDIEYILFFRKSGKYRSTTPLAKALSMLDRNEMKMWFKSIWTDVPGASTAKHPAPFPEELAYRLIRMFSFAGDTVLDPFSGTGTTMVAAMRTGRNSFGGEIDPKYLEFARKRISQHVSELKFLGATKPKLKFCL